MFGMDPFGGDDLFSQFFAGTGLDGLMGMAAPMLAGPRRGRDTVHVLKVTLEDLFNGKVCKLQLQRTALCDHCGGSGSQQQRVSGGSQQQRVCGGCGGGGVTLSLTAGALGLLQQRQTACRQCGGRGRVVVERHRCSNCRGRKVTNQTKILTVSIEPGMTEGQRLTFQGEGNHEPGVNPGDVVVVLRTQPHNTFKRVSHDLYMKKTINLCESLCGLMAPIQHLDNRTVVMTTSVGRVIKPGSVKCLKGQGFPILRRPGYRGDLYVEFEVDFPDAHWASPSTDTSDTCAASAENTYSYLERLLPARPRLEAVPPADSEHADHVHLEDYTANTRSRSSRHAEVYDDEHVHHAGGFHHGGVECAHQ